MNYPAQFELDVTQEDINASIKHRDNRKENTYTPSLHCPVSRAASRILGAPAHSAGTIGVINTTVGYTCRTSDIDLWQNDFDMNLPVEPFKIMVYRK